MGVKAFLLEHLELPLIYTSGVLTLLLVICPFCAYVIPIDSPWAFSEAIVGLLLLIVTIAQGLMYKYD